MILTPSTAAPGATIMVSGRAARKRSTRIRIDGTLVLGFVTGGSGQYNRTVTVPARPDGLYDVTVEQLTDIYRQVDHADPKLTIKNPVVVDSAPTITARPAASEITETSFEVSWSTSEPTTGQVEFGLTTAYGSKTPKELSFTYSDHIQRPSGLVKNTDYHYRVVGEDRAGQPYDSPDQIVHTAGSTEPPPPPPPPPPPGPEPPPPPPPPVEPPIGRVTPPSTVRTAADIRSWLINQGPTTPTALTLGQVYPGTLDLNPLQFDLCGQGALMDTTAASARGIAFGAAHDFRLCHLRAHGATRTGVTPGWWDGLDAAQKPYPTENNHAMSFQGARNGVIEDVDLDTFSGDGAYFAQLGLQPTDGITLRRVAQHRIGRMGYAPVAAKNILTDGCTFENMGYSLFDVEPEYIHALQSDPTKPAEFQGAINCKFLNSVSRGWVGKVRTDKFYDYAVAIQMGTPTVVGPFAPVVANITIDGLVIHDANKGAFTRIGQGAYRMQNIVLRNIEGKRDFGWPNDPVFLAEGVDGLTMVNLRNPNGGGKVVEHRDCTNVVTA